MMTIKQTLLALRAFQARTLLQDLRTACSALLGTMT
jgi:hypothetical protein